MTNLTDKTQNCGLVYCQGDCKVTSITHMEAQRILTLIKLEAIKALESCDYTFTEGGYMEGQITCIELDKAIQAIEGLK